LLLTRLSLTLDRRHKRIARLQILGPASLGFEPSVAYSARRSRHSVTARWRCRAVCSSPSRTVLIITSIDESLCTCSCAAACGAVARRAPQGV
jgi:hypothetical protein